MNKAEIRMQLENEIKRYEKIKKEYFGTIKDAIMNLVSYKILSNIDLHSEIGKRRIGIDKNGFEIFEDNENGNIEICQIEGEMFKSIDLHEIIDDFKNHSEFKRNYWKITSLEIVANSLDRFEVRSIPWNILTIYVDEIKNYNKFWKTIKMEKNKFESINKSNETVLEKLKNDLKTILLANRL